MNLLILGKPGIGKTTLIKEVVKRASFPLEGFYTEEIRERGIRKGFKIITTSGETGMLAHVNFRSEFKVGKYGVNLEEFERVAVSSMLKGLKTNKPIIVDEVGRMELFSTRFRNSLIKALDKQLVIGTIGAKPHPFADRIKERKDVKLLPLTLKNKEEIIKKALKSIKEIIEKC
jgi:nucleoside-triphosphatase